MLKRFHNTERARGAVKVERRGDILVRHRLERVDQEKARFTQKIIDIITSELVVSPGPGLVPGQLKVGMAQKASASIGRVYATSRFYPVSWLHQCRAKNRKFLDSRNNHLTSPTIQ